MRTCLFIERPVPFVTSASVGYQVTDGTSCGFPVPTRVAKLNAEILEALSDPETRALLESQAMQIVGTSPKAFADFIDADIAIWKEVADQAEIEVR